MPIKIGAAYIRASTDDQLEYSPESQLKVIRDYAKREDYLIPDEFVYQDDAISGKTASKRPQFQLLIAQAKEKNPPFDSIFVWEFSRFARNREESVVYKNLLRKNGIAVRSVKEPLPDGPFAGLIESIIEWMDEYYLINLADEVRRGMKEKATRGECMGTAPFGYTAKDKTFVINENAEIVRYLFEAFAAGKGARALAQEMNEKGVRTRRGNAPDNRWVHYILTNPTYIGKIRWSTEGHANYDRPNYAGENVLVVDGKHPPIIDQELWDAVQMKIGKRSTEVKYKRDGKKVFMLKGLVRCGDCGATLTKLTTLSPSLQCHKYAKGQCHVSHSITIEKINAAVVKGLESLAESKEFRFTPQKPRISRVSHDWDKLIASEQARLKRAKSALLDGAFTSEEYKEIKMEIEDSIAKLKAGRDAEARDAQDREPDAEGFAEKVKGVLEIVNTSDADDETKNQAFRSIIDRIVFNKPENTLDFYFRE